MENMMKFIGEVRSPLARIEDCPLQESEDAPVASIEIYPEFVEGISDLKPGATIVLLTWFHQADRSVIKCFPRNNYNDPHIGVFSTRSPNRPNPIGMHKVKITAVQGNVIHVNELEALDKTPVLDIKPWIN